MHFCIERVYLVFFCMCYVSHNYSISHSSVTVGFCRYITKPDGLQFTSSCFRLLVSLLSSTAWVCEACGAPSTSCRVCIICWASWKLQSEWQKREERERDSKTQWVITAEDGDKKRDRERGNQREREKWQRLKWKRWWKEKEMWQGKMWNMGKIEEELLSVWDCGKATGTLFIRTGDDLMTDDQMSLFGARLSSAWRRFS